jgi:hypothetical protein
MEAICCFEPHARLSPLNVCFWLAAVANISCQYLYIEKRQITLLEESFLFSTAGGVCASAATLIQRNATKCAATIVERVEPQRR